jgi:hypothetical protein
MKTLLFVEKDMRGTLIFGFGIAAFFALLSGGTDVHFGRQDYHEKRQHSILDYQTPTEVAEQLRKQ